MHLVFKPAVVAKQKLHAAVLNSPHWTYIDTYIDPINFSCCQRRFVVSAL